MEVIVSEDGNEEGTDYFGSNEPKAADEISFGEKGVIESGGKKMTTKITKIEPATKLKAMKFEEPDANDPGDSAEGDAGADDTSGESPEKK